MIKEVIYKDDNLIQVNFGHMTKEHALKYIENAKEKIDPRIVLTNYELCMFNEIVNELKYKIDKDEWNFLLSLIIKSRKEDCDTKNVANN